MLGVSFFYAAYSYRPFISYTHYVLFIACTDVLMGVSTLLSPTLFGRSTVRA